ncbi:MAG: carbohydrate binding family 9 domain-containing protein [Gemmatimonadetes bacterium]|nr:carbohydrate binding family 9 domain-containing protein [Gemmatimonadota bacterium]
MNPVSAATAALSAFLLPAAVAAQAATVVPSALPGSADHAVAQRLEATSLSGSIQVDGKLDEAAWAALPAFTQFTQFEPANGTAATQRTEVRVAFDASALYIGARMYDSLGSAGVRTRLGRRDDSLEGNLSGDYVQFVFDTFHDHTGRTMFTVNPSGVKGDAGQAAPDADPAWDPVWDLSTSIDSLGWTAELRIPFSQLRYPADAAQTWGIQVWRFVERLNETDMLAHWRQDDQGGPRLFAHLDGIRPPERRLALELLPYALARADRLQSVAAGHPFTNGRERSWRVGGDVKALLSSSVTVDATFNPDFGQVEVDPAVVNLTAFETFFPEKRPFFVEGSGLFSFGGMSCMFCTGGQSLSLFYSRRIGRQPQGSLESDPAFEDRPESTTILGAAKLTARTPSGLQLGILNATTSSERARGVTAAGERFSQEIEPLTNYLVARVKRNSPDGNLQLGAAGTSVYRRFTGDNPGLEELLPVHAEAAGADLNYSWGQRKYSLMGSLALSQVNGDTAAMLRLQRASSRYFQRPDRGNGSNRLLSDAFDPGLNTLRGAAAYARVAKESGLWLWETQVDLRTPGFEVNDAAFLTRADYTRVSANLARAQTKPGRTFRRWDILAGGSQQANFDGDVTDREFHLWLGRITPNTWMNTGFLIFRPERLDDRATRGGAVVRQPSSWMAALNIQSDGRQPIVGSLGLNGGRSADGGYDLNTELELQLKPTAAVSLSLGPSWSRGRTQAQYVRAFTDPAASSFFGRRAIFAAIDQRELSLETRLSATFSPTLSLELFAQPFVAAGDYDAFKEYVRPRSTSTRTFAPAQIAEVRDEQGRVQQYLIDADGDPATAGLRIDNPDFNTRSLRGNAVLRWEYRPGSTLFLVWQQQRSGDVLRGDFELGRDAAAIFRNRPDNIFVVKASYWLGL